MSGVPSPAPRSLPISRLVAFVLVLMLPLAALVHHSNQQHQRAFAAAYVEPHSVNPNVPGFTVIDAANASTVSMQGTAAAGIDTAGDVAGVYIDTRKVRHGFLRDAATGTVTSFDAPLAGSNAQQYNTNEGTVPISMDSAGDIGGFYIDANGIMHGFMRASTGTFTVIDVPAATSKYEYGLGTIVTAVNASGAATGYYRDGTTSATRGFVRTSDGSFSTFATANSSSDVYNPGTQPFAINASGVVTGTYSDTARVHHGFVRAVDGTITQFDIAGATGGSNTAQDVRGTFPLGIDAAGDIVGVYSDSSNLSHGFLRPASTTSSPVTIDAPGAGTTFSSFAGLGAYLTGTAAVSINSNGVIAGLYMDANNVAHGFTRSASGTITNFAAPLAGGTSGGFQGTAGLGINAAGAIAGTYLDSNSVLHGFVYGAPTTVSVTPVSSSITTAQSLSVTIVVAGGTPTPTGTVTLSSGTYASTATTLNNGSATISIPAGTLSKGSDTLTAVYTPDTASSPLYVTGTGTNSVTVNTPSAVSTSLVLSANPTSTAYGQQVALTATLTPNTSQAGNATGQVTFYSGSTSLGSAALSSGVATINVTSLAVGTDSLTAVYAGDASFATSTSAPVSETVQQNFIVPATSIGTQTVSVGGTATYTFTVTPSGGSTFSSAVTFAATGLPTGATATFTPSTITAGSGTTTVTMTVAVPNVARLEKIGRPGEKLPLVALALLLLPFAGKMRRSGKRLGRLTTLMLLLMTAGTLAMISGCSSGGSSSTNTTSIKGNYTITVTATSSGLSHTTTAALTVQ